MVNFTTFIKALRLKLARAEPQGHNGVLTKLSRAYDVWLEWNILERCNLDCVLHFITEACHFEQLARCNLVEEYILIRGLWFALTPFVQFLLKDTMTYFIERL